MPSIYDFTSYGLFDRDTNAPIGSINSTEAGSPSNAKKIALQSAREYERVNRCKAYVTEAKVPRMWKTPVPVMKTKVVYGTKKGKR